MLRRFVALFALGVALCAASPAIAANAQVNPNTYKTLGSTYGRSAGLFQDSRKVPFLVDNAGPSIIAGSPTYAATFAMGAGKGLYGIQSDGTAFDSTANTLNYVHLAGGLVLGQMNIVDAGTNEAAVTANGLDMAAGASNDNDHWELFAGGAFGVTTGRPLVPGYDPAFRFCATVYIEDVSDSDLFYCGWRDPAYTTVSVASYTSYAAIGIGSATGDIYVNDKTTGGTDTTNNWADGETKELCTLVSSAGVVTYTIDGQAPTTTDAHSFTTGTFLVPFCAGRNNAATPDEFALTRWEVSYQ